jgi:hypothetical protein
MTKVVLATDIAETSVTIPDVTLVINGGTHKMMSMDQVQSTLHYTPHYALCTLLTYVHKMMSMYQVRYCTPLLLYRTRTALHSTPTVPYSYSRSVLHSTHAIP